MFILHILFTITCTCIRIYIHLYNTEDAVILTVSVCLCGVTANVALVHSILEHQTRGNVVGIGDQVVSEPLSSSISCVVK